jgi:3-hydroxyacyl-CoA dehydrogenase/enoyl-CoA hydratase/3-hydroxybutyryl-CoA epimerase
VLRYMNESYNMLAEGVPPAMIENAAKMAGMPVGPLALNDEVAIDLSLKIVRATIADLGEKAVDPRHLELVETMVEKEGRLGRKNGKGFYDYPAKPAKKHLWPGLKTLYPQQDPAKVDVRNCRTATWRQSRSKRRAPWRKASSPIRARPISAPSSASASRPTRAVR